MIPVRFTHHGGKTDHLLRCDLDIPLTTSEALGMLEGSGVDISTIYWTPLNVGDRRVLMGRVDAGTPLHVMLVFPLA